MFTLMDILEVMVLMYNRTTVQHQIITFITIGAQEAM